MTEDDTKAPDGGEDDLHRRFRTALERKKSSKRAG